MNPTISPYLQLGYGRTPSIYPPTILTTHPQIEFEAPQVGIQDHSDTLPLNGLRSRAGIRTGVDMYAKLSRKSCAALSKYVLACLVPGSIRKGLACDQVEAECLSRA